MTEPQIISGRYDYRNAANALIGWENFSVSTSAAEIVLNSHAVFLAEQLQRHVLHVATRDYLPREAYVRVTREGHHNGSASYMFGQDTVAVRTYPADTHQTVALNTPRPIFGTHALANDGWYLAALLTEDVGTRQVYRAPVISISEDGGDPPGLFWADVTVASVGVETVETPAGTFECLRGLLGFAEYPPIDLWIRVEDGLLIRQEWSLLSTSYQLSRIESEPVAGRLVDPTKYA